jgi:hypothetical protein
MGCIGREVELRVKFLPFFKTMTGSKDRAEFSAAHQPSMLVGHCVRILMPDNIPEGGVGTAQQGGKSAQ